MPVELPADDGFPSEEVDFDGSSPIAADVWSNADVSSVQIYFSRIVYENY